MISIRLYCRVLAGLFFVLFLSSCASTKDPVQQQRQIYGQENLWMLASQWTTSPDEALFYALGDKLQKLKVPSWENKQFVAMQHFGTPVNSSMLKEPRFLEYRLLDGRVARLNFGKNGQKFKQVVEAPRTMSRAQVEAVLPPVPPPMNP